MCSKRTSRRGLLRSLGIATTVGIATASDSQQFIGPVRADHNRHNWTRNSFAYHDTEEDRANTGIGHCTTIGCRGSYEHPNHEGAYRHEFTFSAQATAELDGDKRYCITDQKYKVQGDSDNVNEIYAGTGVENGITPWDAENWDADEIAEEVATEAADEVGRWVDRAATAYEILDAMVKASPEPTSESGPGWTDSDSYGTWSQPAEIGQNSRFIVDIENSKHAWTELLSTVDTVPKYPDTMKGFDLYMREKAVESYKFSNSKGSTSTTGEELAYPEHHPEELPQETIEKYGIEKVAPDTAGLRAIELDLTQRSIELWKHADEPIFFYHNPPIMAISKSSTT